MFLQIGERPAPTFAAPLELLSDCHRRIERFLDLLLRVATQARGGPLSKTQREALEAALRYFREAAPKHTQDEELSLFPRLRLVRGLLSPEASAQLTALEDDHRQAELAHATVETIGQRWLANDGLAAADLADLVDTLTTLRATYARHIRQEDEEIFPLAARLLDAPTLRAVGAEMAGRRGQSLPPP